MNPQDLLTQLQVLDRERPFHPYRIRTSSGREHVIAKPDHWMSSEDGSAIVVTKDKLFAFIDLSAVTEILIERTKGN